MLTRRGHKQLTWLDLYQPTHEEVRTVVREWNIHPLVGDELLTPSFRQKTERYGEFLYLVLRMPGFSAQHDHKEQEIDIVVGRRMLVTATYEDIPALRAFAGAFESTTAIDHGPLGSHGGHVLFLMIQKLYRSLGDEIEYIREELRRIEERIFLGQEKKMVFEISRISRILLDFRRTLAPHQEILTSLEAAGGRIFGQEFSFYARLLESEFLKVQSGLDEMRDALQELRETNNSLLSTKQNEVMQNLTVVAFIFLPLSFVSSLFQMNTAYTPIVGLPYDFWIIAGTMVGLGLLFFLYFKHKEWL